MIYLVGGGVVAVLVVGGYLCARYRAQCLAEARPLRSLPTYHGWYAVAEGGAIALPILGLWLLVGPWLTLEMGLASLPPGTLESRDPHLIREQLRSALAGQGAFAQPLAPELQPILEHIRGWQHSGQVASLVLIAAGVIVGICLGLNKIDHDLPAREQVEWLLSVILLLCSLVAITTTIGIVISLLFESIRFFHHVSPVEFLFGLHWSPQIALREGQVGASGQFGAVPLFTGTVLITAVAMTVAVPVGLMTAIYLAEYASAGVRACAKPALEALAGIPTVVYGFFAALAVAPFLRDTLALADWQISGESALVAGGVMGVMILPFVSSLTDDVIKAVPQALRDGSYGLGATKSETVLKIILPAALPGIFGAFTLAVGRAIGETMIVVMAAGLSANLTANPFEAVTTVTVQIATLLVGDQEFDDPKTLSAFALGLVLFTVTLMLNLLALRFVKAHERRYG